MNLKEAAERLKNKSVTAITAGGGTVKGKVGDVGDDFVDVQWSIGKSTLIPFAHLLSLKED